MLTTRKIFFTSLLGVVAGLGISLAILALLAPRIMPRMMQSMMSRMEEAGCQPPDA